MIDEMDKYRPEDIAKLNEAAKPTDAFPAIKLESTGPVPAIKVGSKVTWTHVSQQGSRVKLSTRHGTVVLLYAHTARVKMRNGRHTWERLSELVLEGHETQLTKAFKAMVEAM